VDIGDVVTCGGQLSHLATEHGLGFVCGVVEHLNVQPVPWVGDPAHRLEEPLPHIQLIEHGELDGDPGQFLLGKRVLGRRDVLAVLVVQVHQQATVRTVDCQQHEDQSIGT